MPLHVADLSLMGAAQMPKDPAHTTVLLVEDSKFLRIANSQTLSRAGYKVITAADGEEALRMTSQDHPDLIVLDMLLPKLPGLDALRILKQDPATKQIPVVILSSLSRVNEEKLKDDGAAEFIEKSSLENDKAQILVSVVQKVLRRVARYQQ